MKLTGKIEAVNIDAKTGGAHITFSINECADLLWGFVAIKDVDTLIIDVNPPRSKNANAYAWKLICEIADVLRNSKEEIYMMMLQRYGQSEIISVLADVPINKFVKYYDLSGECSVNGVRYNDYRVYKGSSEFNSREMAIFIDGIIAEAKELGVQTEPPEEIERIKLLWKE